MARKKAAKNGPVITYDAARLQAPAVLYGTQKPGPAPPPTPVYTPPPLDKFAPPPEPEPAESVELTARQIAIANHSYSEATEGPDAAVQRRINNAIKMASEIYANIVSDIDDKLLEQPDAPELIYSFGGSVPEDVIAFVVARLQREQWLPQFDGVRSVQIKLPVVPYICELLVQRHISKVQPL